MSASDDSMNEMFGHLLGPADADALLEGWLAPDDAPPGYQEVAAVVRAARSAPAPGDLAGEDAVVSAFAEAAAETDHGVSYVREWRPRRRMTSLSAKTVGVAAVLALGATSAAAATGSLPQPVQAALSRNLSHLGVDVPDPGSSSGVGNGPSGTATPTSQTPENLCGAYLSTSSGSSVLSTGGTGLSSIDLSRLRADARDKGETVDEFCSAVTGARSPVGDTSENDTSASNQSSPTGAGDGQEQGSNDGGSATAPSDAGSPTPETSTPSPEGDTSSGQPAQSSSDGSQGSSTSSSETAPSGSSSTDSGSSTDQPSSLSSGSGDSGSGSGTQSSSSPSDVKLPSGSSTSVSSGG